MKKSIIFLSLVWAVAAQAQILEVASVERLNIPHDDNSTMQAVAISPQGDYLLLSTDTKQGLVKWDFATGKATTLTKAEGCGSEVRISDDGKQVVYGEVTYKDKRRQQAVKAVDATSGKTQTLVKPTRHLQGFDLQGGTAVTFKEGKAQRHTLNRVAASSTRPVLSHYHLQLFITRDGVTSLLAPNGADERYIWSSLSPDGNRVLYYVSGKGAFVCDVDGSHVIAMGDITAPKWWDDNTIIGMKEEYNEYTVTASSIVVRTLDGQEQTITGDDVIATYPQPCKQAGRIVFSTPDGNIHLITLN